MNIQKILQKFDSFIYLSFNAKLCLYIIKIRGKKHTHTITNIFGMNVTKKQKKI